MKTSPHTSYQVWETFRLILINLYLNIIYLPFARSPVFQTFLELYSRSRPIYHRPSPVNRNPRKFERPLFLFSSLALSFIYHIQFNCHNYFAS